MAKRGKVAIEVVSTAFLSLGKSMARSLGYPELPMAIIPHPFGVRRREEVRRMAETCVDDIARLACESVAAAVIRAPAPVKRAVPFATPDDPRAINKLFIERRWGDGLPVIPPTVDAVEDMLRHTHRAPDEIVARIAPAFGVATVEHVAINAVIAGCDPAYLPVLIAATEAVAAPEFNLQSIQATTHPVAVWLIVNGPIVNRLGINAGANCLGQGAHANATLGRALRLILQNIGGALPGEMDRATHGQPGKYTFCCAENEDLNPWEPLHVERGFARAASTVTVVGAGGLLNNTILTQHADDLLRVIADTIAHPSSNDYWFGGAPWLVFSPEHAAVLNRAGLSKSEVKRRLWHESKMAAGRMAREDLVRTQAARVSELGEIGPDTMLPVSPTPDEIGIIVAGGAGTHTVYVPSFGPTRAVTREVVFGA
jgi:hypothetical protein